MKYIKLLLLVALLSLSALTVFAPSQGYAALSKAAQQKCYTDWNGKSSPVGKFPAGYIKSKCDSGSGGNCSKQTSSEAGKQSAVIKCTNPSVDTSGDATGITDVPDPAADPTKNPCKTVNNCDLVTKYVNPIINDFLAPMAVLAVIIGIIWGGIEFSTSGGDPQRAAQGKAHIQKALIGLVAFLLLFGFLEWLLPGGLI